MFDRAKISVEADLCLNARHKDAGCQKCVDSCPVDAITLAGVRPVLDADVCVHCGICLHACPTDVFAQRHSPEERLMQTLEKLPAKPLELVCSYHESPGATAAPVAGVVRHGRCLAALSVENLLALSQNGQRSLWLDDSVCAGCPIGQAQRLMAETTRVTNQLLVAFEQPRTIFTHIENPEQLQDEFVNRPVVDGMKPQLSRRGFFGAFGRAAREQIINAVDHAVETPPESPKTVSERLPHHVPQSRVRLIQRLAEYGSELDTAVNLVGLPFANVQVDDTRCSACALCARFCPTGALTFVQDDDHFKVDFLPAICVDCGICAVACPENAVAIEQQLLPAAAALVDLTPTMLVGGDLVACTQCGAATAIRLGEGETPHCYSCRSGAGTVQPLRDGAGLMADLRQRWMTE